MPSTSIPDSLPEPSTRRASPRASPFMPILVGILIALIVVAVWQPFARRPAKTTASHLRGDTDEAVGALTEVLMRTPQERRESLLLQYVQDPSPGLRYASVDALARERGPGAADAIERAFLDSSSVVRQGAMEALPSV